MNSCSTAESSRLRWSSQNVLSVDFACTGTAVAAAAVTNTLRGSCRHSSPWQSNTGGATWDSRTRIAHKRSRYMRLSASRGSSSMR